MLQFKERVKDCHLIDSTDQDLIKWLIGEKKDVFIILCCSFNNHVIIYAVKEFDVDQSEKLLRQVNGAILLCNIYLFEKLWLRIYV